MRGEETKHQRWFDARGVAEGAREEAVDEGLEGLGDAGGEFAAVLDVCQGEFGD